jgi:hypothetical protein
MTRSSQPEVRNPILALPAAQELAQMMRDNPELKATFKRLCRELKAQAREQERNSIRRRKGPMVSYWMSCGTWCAHLANACGRG